MNHKHLESIFEQYTERFDEFNNYGIKELIDESFKWKAVSQFRNCWDAEADDFQKMFKDAISETKDLIGHGKFRPNSGITTLFDHGESEFVRECFKELFSEDGGDIDSRQKRAEIFRDKINSRLSLYMDSPDIYAQNMNSVTCYISLWRPEENYIYKYTEAKAWADCIEFYDDFGAGSSLSLSKYYRMCDELLVELQKELQNNDELRMKHEERMRKMADGFDDGLHLMVFDIIYCAYNYGFYNGMYIPKLSLKERNEKKEKEEKVEELHDLEEELKELIVSLEKAPDIIGQSVKHKNLGKGIVVSCTKSVFTIKFLDKELTFGFPDSINHELLVWKNDFYVKEQAWIRTYQYKRKPYIECRITELKRKLEI